MTISFSGNLKVLGNIAVMFKQIVIDYKLIILPEDEIEDYGTITASVSEEKDFGFI
jgi:hypothetical protein